MLLQFKLEYAFFLQILAEHSHVLCMQHRLYLQRPLIAVYVCVYIYMCVDMLKTVHLFAYSLSIV